jgi:putative transposase
MGALVRPGFRGVGFLDKHAAVPSEHREDSIGRRGCPAEFRHRVRDLAAAGCRVEDVARELGISDPTNAAGAAKIGSIRALGAGLTSAERAELLSASRRIHELETELAIAAGQRNAQGNHKPKSRFAAIEVMAPRVSRCKSPLACSRSPNLATSETLTPRSIRHEWLTDLIRQVHAASRGTYGIRPVHDEVTLGSACLHLCHGRRPSTSRLSARLRKVRIRTMLPRMPTL